VSGHGFSRAVIEQVGYGLQPLRYEHSELRTTQFLASEDTPLIKQDIVHQVIERTGLPRTKAEAAVDTVFEGLKQALAAGERIELRGFGVFSVRARKTGIGRNPRTGTEVSIAPGKAVRFKPGKELHSLPTGS
jgi:nucleoid DNA-binding protein